MEYRLSMAVIFSFALLLAGCTQEGGGQEQLSEYQKYQEAELQRSLKRINALLEDDKARSPEDVAQLKTIKAILEEKLGLQQPAR